MGIQLLVPGALLALWGLCLWDFARTPAQDLRGFDWQTWLLLLVFTGVVGGVLWLIQGRPQGGSRR
jgi:hypothetical protein